MKWLLILALCAIVGPMLARREEKPQLRIAQLTRRRVKIKNLGCVPAENVLVYFYSQKMLLGDLEPGDEVEIRLSWGLEPPDLYQELLVIYDCGRHREVESQYMRY